MRAHLQPRPICGGGTNQQQALHAPTPCLAGLQRRAHLQPRPICGGGTKTHVSAPPEAALISSTCREKLVAREITCVAGAPRSW